MRVMASPPRCKHKAMVIDGATLVIIEPARQRPYRPSAGKSSDLCVSGKRGYDRAP